MDKRNLIVMVKCELGRTYDVAAALADLPEAPIVYSTSETSAVALNEIVRSSIVTNSKLST